MSINLHGSLIEAMVRGRDCAHVKALANVLFALAILAFRLREDAVCHAASGLGAESPMRLHFEEQMQCKLKLEELKCTYTILYYMQYAL